MANPPYGVALKGKPNKSSGNSTQQSSQAGSSVERNLVPHQGPPQRPAASQNPTLSSTTRRLPAPKTNNAPSTADTTVNARLELAASNRSNVKTTVSPTLGPTSSSTNNPSHSFYSYNTVQAPPSNLQQVPVPDTGPSNEQSSNRSHLTSDKSSATATQRVAKVKDSEVPHNPPTSADTQSAVFIGGWKKRKLCGIPVPILAVLMVLLAIGGVVGGAVGGTVKKKGGPARPRSTRTAVFEFPVENKRYNIVNGFSGAPRYLSAKDGHVVVEKTAENAEQQWVFSIARNATVKHTRLGPNGPRYKIKNRADGSFEPPLLGVYAENLATDPGKLCFEEDSAEGNTTVLWYWDGDWVDDGSTDGITELALVNENFTRYAQYPAWAVKLNESAPVRLENFPARKNALPGAAYWYLETGKSLIAQPEPTLPTMTRTAILTKISTNTKGKTTTTYASGYYSTSTNTSTRG